MSRSYKNNKRQKGEGRNPAALAAALRSGAGAHDDRYFPCSNCGNDTGDARKPFCRDSCLEEAKLDGNVSLHQERAYEKQLSREKDQEDLENGVRTVEQINQDNSLAYAVGARNWKPRRELGVK